MKADRLKHGRPTEALSIPCHCECSRYMLCPIDETSPDLFRNCKAAYKATLKDMKAARDKAEAKANGNA